MRLAKGGVAHVDLHIAHLQREAHHQHIDDARDKHTNQRRKEWPIGCDRAERSAQKILLLFGHKQNGAADRTRTGDLRFTKAPLYQLSYSGITAILY